MAESDQALESSKYNGSLCALCNRAESLMLRYTLEVCLFLEYWSII